MSPAPRRLCLLTLAALGPACATEKVAPCPPGSHREPADGLCHLDDHGADTAPPGDPGEGDSGSTGGAGDGDSGAGGEDGGSSGGDSGDDGGTGGLDCTAPPGLAADPITALDALDLQRHVFAEVVDVAVDDDRGIAWAVGQGGLMAVDLRSPTGLDYLGRTHVPATLDRFTAVTLGPGTTVYATSRELGIYAVDGTDPRALPDPVGIAEDEYGGMARVGDRLYATRHTGELVVFDISSPLALTERARIDGLANPWRPIAAGDRLYIADNTLGIGIVDISDPDAPALVGTVAAAGGVQDLALSADGSALYAAVGGAGVETFSLADPDAPASLGTHALGASVISVATDGDQLWAVNQQDLVAFDVSTPAAPVGLNARRTPPWAMAVTATGGRAYVGDWAWLEVYSAAGAPVPLLDPSTPTLHVPDGGATRTVQLANPGSVPLTLTDWGTDAPGVALSLDTTTVAPGAAATLTITAPPGALDHSVCLASTDPDTPVQTIALQSQDADGRGVGIPAPDFSLLDLDGNVHRLSDQEGVPVVLVYFATW